MNSHLGFWRAILATPHDPAPRLVYSDWLEEQGDPTSRARAEYLRVECQLDALPRKHNRRAKLRTRLRELQAIVGDDWWRALDCSPVEACVTFAFKCPQRWNNLQLTDDESIRHCSQCDQDVYYCHTTAEARQHAASGHCVAVDMRATRLPGDINRSERRRLLGRVMPHVRRRMPLPMRVSPTGRGTGVGNVTQGDVQQ
ncbi:MAG: TIGR02996 domain-containing protein [Gemmataceae bacterium]|nr:TIGR02996 domain-containing protein [Gemmataceae bacterium]